MKTLKDTQNEKNKATKTEQTKDKHPAEEDLGTLQTDNSEEVWEHLLYVSPDKLIWKQLADWTHVGKGKSGSVFEVRLTSITPTVLQLQYKPRRSWSGLLRKDVTRNRGKRNDETPKRTLHNSKSIRPLPKGFGKVQGRTF